MGVVQCTGQLFSKLLASSSVAQGDVGCFLLVPACVLMVEGSLFSEFEHAHKVR